MPTKLKAINPQLVKPGHLKGVLFGKPGAGKTWTALGFPGVFLIDTENGARLAHYTEKLVASGGVYLGPSEGSQDFETVINQIIALSTEKHPYKTLVIDSITKLFELEIAREAERLGSKDAFGASKKPAVAHMRRLVSLLEMARTGTLAMARGEGASAAAGAASRAAVHADEPQSDIAYSV